MSIIPSLDQRIVSHGEFCEAKIYRFHWYGQTGTTHFRHLRLSTAREKRPKWHQFHWVCYVVNCTIVRHWIVSKLIDFFLSIFPFHRNTQIHSQRNEAVRSKRLRHCLLPSGIEGRQQTVDTVPVEFVQRFGSQFSQKFEKIVCRPSDAVHPTGMEFLQAVHQWKVQKQIDLLIEFGWAQASTGIESIGITRKHLRVSNHTWLVALDPVV